MFPLFQVCFTEVLFSFWETAETMNTCRIHKVNDVIGRGVPENSVFGTLGSPLLLRLGCDWTLEDRRASPREYPQISMFSSSGFPQLRRERETPRRDHSSSWEKAANSSSNNALGMHFLEPVQRGLAYILSLRWCLVNGEPFPGEDDIACLHSCLQLHHRERLLSVGFSGTAHSVLQHSVGLRRWMRFPNRRLWRQTHSITVLVSMCLSHCACLTMLVSVLLPNVLLLSSWLSSLG